MVQSRSVLLPVFLIVAGACWPQTAPDASLRGTVTDPSGASVPGALVQLRGPGGERRATTDEAGRYTLSPLTPGSYLVRVIAKGFTVSQKQAFAISSAVVLDVQLTVEVETQVVNVEEEANKVNTDPASNASALVLGEKELEALSDDPDELQQQLQAMAGPGAGPNGGQIYIDGFTGSNLPPKASIREVRINSNPFSPEYDRPGFGRIEIFTKPGTDVIHGQAFAQFNDESLNSRSPLLTQATRPPYQQKFFGLNLSGPIRKQKASFGLNVERRNIDENAFILATTLDDSLNLRNVNQAVVTPQTRTEISPRLDLALSPKNTLIVRYQDTRVQLDNQGVGDFSLASRSYKETDRENTVQVTETAVLSPNAILETRLQYMHSLVAKTGDNSVPAISVQGAFDGGGAQVGNSGTRTDRLELTSAATYTHRTHTVKWGGRLRQSFLDDTSVSNFGGTYTFFGGAGPELDASNQPIPGSSVQLTALERYRRTLLLQTLGYNPAQIRLLGGGAAQFSLSAGTPTTDVNQFDIGLFVSDDWRARPNLTLSYGLRYETQTNIRDFSDWSPRIGIAWGMDGRANRAARTILRAGFGVFYDRIADTVTLQVDRFNGTTQQSYFLLNPDTFPSIPSASVLAGSQQPQRLQVVYSGIQAPRTYQASVGVERQINRYARFTVSYVESRGVHLLRSLNSNTPISGAYPYGDREVRLLTESNGFSRTHQVFVNPNVNYKGLFLFGFYALSYGRSDNEGQPADPYNLRAEWGPSTFGDVRHRFALGTNLPLPWKLSITPFLLASSGAPYNITTGRDTNGDSFTSERPALLAGVAAADCRGDRVYAAGFGCFDLNPAPGVPVIGRNAGRGPASVNFNFRLSRTWGFGTRGESGPAGDGPPPGVGGVRGGPPAGGPPAGVIVASGPPRGMFGGGATGKKYNLTLSFFVLNALNHPNYAAPSGDLSSPYFGEYRNLAGFGPFGGNNRTYSRKIDVQLRFAF